MAYTGSIELISGLKPANNGTFPLMDAKDVRVDDSTRLSTKLVSIDNRLSTSGGRPMIYCYGDSLTEGVGGRVMQPDGFNAYMAYSYPAWVGQVYDVVNMGARGENVNTIMARQGADPIVTTFQITIPAGTDSAVAIGEVTNLWQAGQTGLTTKSGAMACPLVEVEAAGINPVVIKGVEGILYREVGAALNAGDSFTYYFRRLNVGEEVEVPIGTEVETFAMRYYRNGIAIIWMGANGGFTNAQDYINKISAMLSYGGYTNYVIIVSRELTGANLAAVKEAFTEENGFCHVVDLMEQLPWRGYGMAGIPYEPVDTSGWSELDPPVTDTIKLAAPLLCEYVAGTSGSTSAASYGTLHYSAWGYKAIGKLVIEKLGEMGLVSGGSGGGSSTTGDDQYGHYVYKLPEPKELVNDRYINTKISLYDDVAKDWTFAIKWHGTPSTTGPGGWPCVIFCCTLDGSDKGLLYRYYTEAQGSVLVGDNGIYQLNSPYIQNITDHWGGTNICIIVKSGDTYNMWLNSTNKVNNAPLTGLGLDPEDAFSLPLLIGARYNAEGTDVTFPTSFTVDDCRIYNSALDSSDAIDLYDELANE